MNKLIFTLTFTLSMFLFTNFSNANHCSGGHKEIKDTSDTSTEESKEAKSN